VIGTRSQIERVSVHATGTVDDFAEVVDSQCSLQTKSIKQCFSETNQTYFLIKARWLHHTLQERIQTFLFNIRLRNIKKRSNTKEMKFATKWILEVP
jgi:hypothetical protein